MTLYRDWCSTNLRRGLAKLCLSDYGLHGASSKPQDALRPTGFPSCLSHWSHTVPSSAMRWTSYECFRNPYAGRVLGGGEMREMSLRYTEANARLR